jgi:Fe-Mn family superoxide dismutase
MNPESSVLSPDRRHFVAAGGVALASLVLAPALARAQNGPGVTNSSPFGPLFDCPVNADGTYALPPLPYAYEALEPSIDAETMRLHHDKHFAAYMNGLNAALKQVADFRSKNDFPQIQYWENQLAFQGSGYFLHVGFFQNLAPAGSTKPSDDLQKALAADFGSFDAFKAQFSAAATAVEGSGWAILGWQPFGQKFVILQAEKHQNLGQWGAVPILALDVWEHAYYLKYKNVRADYIKAWWNVVNWENVDKRVTAVNGLMVM